MKQRFGKANSTNDRHRRWRAKMMPSAPPGSTRALAVGPGSFLPIMNLEVKRGRSFEVTSASSSELI